MGEPRWEVKTAIQEEGFTFTELLVAITIPGAGFDTGSLHAAQRLTATRSWPGGRPSPPTCAGTRSRTFKAKGYSGCINLFKNSAGLIHEIPSAEDPLPGGI